MVAFANKITPTEVAYFLIQKFHDFAIQVEELQDQMRQCVMSILEQEKHKLSQIENNHRLITTRFITHEKSKLDNLQNMMKLSAKNIIENQKKDLQALKEHIQLLHPDNVLKRGYSITLLDGKAVTQAKQIKSGDILTTRLFKGNIESEVK